MCRTIRSVHAAPKVEKGDAEPVTHRKAGGGAFLEFLEGKSLPEVAILEERAAKR